MRLYEKLDYTIRFCCINTAIKLGGFVMKTFNLLLSSINDVKDFVNVVSKYDFDVDLTSGRYVVDAKSIMGIFSLDLSQPIKVEVHSDDCDSFIAELKPFIVD